MLAVALWALLALGSEARITFERHAHPVRNIRQTGRWLPGTRQVLALERFLTHVDRLVPPGSQIAFVPPAAAGDGKLYQYLWASYLLPSRDLIPALGERLPDADYVAVFRGELSQPQLVLLTELPEGRLYRRVPGR